MEYEEIKGMCVHLNQLISQALFKHRMGDQPSLQERDLALTQAKDILAEFLNGLPKNPDVQSLVDLQAELTQLMANVNIYADDIPMELIFQVNRIVSEALANHSKTENMELLILLNKEISAALIDRTQMVRRGKLQAIMGILSSKTKDSADKNELTRALFRMKEVLVDTLGENALDKKHELLLKLNILLGAFMVSGHQDKSTEWMVKLNYYAALSMVKNFTDPGQLCLMNQYLAHAIRKILPDEAIFKDLTQLNFYLASLIMAPDAQRKLGQMIEWKAIFSDVMQEALEGNCLRYREEQGTTVAKQVTFAEMACLKAQLAQVSKERDFFMKELIKSSSFHGGLEMDVQRNMVEAPKPRERIAGKGGQGTSKTCAEREGATAPVVDGARRLNGLIDKKKFPSTCMTAVNLNEVTHLRLILSANLDEEEDAEEVTRKQEGTSAGAGQSYSAEKTVVSGKGTETPEKKKPEDAGQQNAEIPVGAQMQAEKSEEKAGAVGEEKREVPKEEKREPPKEEKKAKSVTRFTYVLPPQAKKPDASP